MAKSMKTHIYAGKAYSDLLLNANRGDEATELLTVAGHEQASPRFTPQYFQGY